MPTGLGELVAGTAPVAALHAAFEALTVGLVILNLEGKIQYANRTYCEIAGYTMEELFGREFLSLKHPEDRDAARARLAGLQRGEQQSVRMESRSISKSGAVLWVDVGVSLLRGPDQRPHAMIAVIEDVTRQYMMEESRRELQREREALLHELRGAEELLHRTEKLAATGRLAATVAHEINNPLEAVGNLMYLALREEPMPLASVRYLQMANEELRRVGHIVSQTLAFYRDSGVPQPVDLTSLVNDVLTLYQRRLDARQIRVTRSMESGVMVEGIASELRQVVANLLSNALDAMEPYGVLGMEVRSQQEGARLSISDTGHGIATPALDHIFEPFFTTKKEAGTGLGLWVSKGIVEKHKGQLHVMSSQQEEDHGTSFVLTLPRRDVTSKSA